MLYVNVHVCVYTYIYVSIYIYIYTCIYYHPPRLCILFSKRAKWRKRDIHLLKCQALITSRRHSGVPRAT